MARSADKIADRRARRSSRTHQSFALELDAELQALGDARRFLLKYECIFRIENIVGRFSPQGKPEVEIGRGHGAVVAQMGGHRWSLIRSAHEPDRRPEGLQLLKMPVSIVNCAIEDRANTRVPPD